MHKIILFLVVFLSSALSLEKENIIDVLERYNKAFGEENYSKIISFFDYPTSFNLKDKTVTANNRFKLRLIYKKLRGDIPEYYSYSKWDSINIELKDSLMIRNDLMKSFRENLNIKEDSNLYKQKQNIIDSTKVKINSIVE